MITCLKSFPTEKSKYNGLVKQSRLSLGMPVAPTFLFMAKLALEKPP
jgi:hypothetical protein